MSKITIEHITDSIIPKPYIREREYKVTKGFYLENRSVTAEPEDIVYLNFGDNNFYLEKIKTKRIYTLEWSFGMKAVRYGWVELVNVEKPEQCA